MNRPGVFLSSLIILALIALVPSCSNSPTEEPVSPNTQTTGNIDPKPGSGTPIFGPVDVGPGTAAGTVLETTFSVPLFFVQVQFYLLVTPPPIMAPYPLRVDTASVTIDGATVWDFACTTPDGECLPFVKVPIELYIEGNDNLERHIRIVTEGEEPAFLIYAIVAETILPDGQQ